VPSAADVISPWLAGLRLSDFPGSTPGVQAVNAAHSIKADIMSTMDIGSTVLDPALPGYVPFTTKTMVDRAHQLGMTVIPWTVCCLISFPVELIRRFIGEPPERC
jgi:hypothetical protein